MTSNDEIRELLSDMFMGDEEILNEIVMFENPDYASAVIGISDDHNLIYDYNLMIEHLMEKEDMSCEDAIDFINYDSLRALPYFSSYGKTPIIKYDLPL